MTNKEKIIRCYSIFSGLARIGLIILPDDQTLPGETPCFIVARLPPASSNAAPL